jgi:hypothetical protein
MNWKKDLKLSDLDAGTRLEVVCTKCGISRYESKEQLSEMPGMRRAYIDEIEKALRCNSRDCRWSIVRVSLIYEGKTEGFVGGMP